MLLSVEDLVAIAVAVAGGTVPAVLTYFFSERSGRAQLEREQEYSRRREEYEQVLYALRLQRDATETFQAFVRLHSAAAIRKGAGEPEAPITPTQLGELVIMLSKLLAIAGDVLAEKSEPTFSAEELFTAKPEDRERVFGAIIDTTTRCLFQADLDVRNGLTSLKLVDGSEDFEARASAMNENLAEPARKALADGPTAWTGFEFDWGLVEREFGDLELLALQDLKEVLGHPIDVELSRVTPPKTVEAKRAVRRNLQRSNTGTIP